MSAINQRQEARNMFVVPEFKTKIAMKRACAEYGLKSTILSVGADAKTVGGRVFGYETGIIYMMPSSRLCPASKIAKCHDSCLVTAGRARIFKPIAMARAAKARLFLENTPLFFAKLIQELFAAKNKYGKQFCCRLNGTSDIAYENISFIYKGNYYNNLFELFHDVQFYDYTKRLNRLEKIISNYDLTASYSSASASYAARCIEYGKHRRIAVVFRNKHFPKYWHGMPVIDGNDDDLRFLEPTGVIVALKAKGAAKYDDTGFVQECNANIVSIG